MIDNGNDENYYFGKIAIRLKLIADGEGYQNSKVHIEEFPSQVLKAQYLIEVIRFYRKYEWDNHKREVDQHISSYHIRAKKDISKLHF